MRKFHDVKPREWETSQKHGSQEGEDFSVFWSGLSKEKQNKRLSTSRKKVQLKISPKILLFAAGTFAVMVFSTGRVLTTKEQMEMASKNASASLQKALVLMGQGETDLAVEEAEKAREYIYQTKLYAQSIGQDHGYLSLISDKGSSLIENERLLNATNLLLDGVLGIKKEFSGDLKNNVAHASDNTFYFDVVKNAEAYKRIFNHVRRKIDSSEELLDKINITRLPEQEDNIHRAKSVVSNLKGTLSDLDQFLNHDLPWLTGNDGSAKKVLLVFQNNAELRGGSGGSFGSFGIMNFNSGKLEKIDFGKNIFKIDSEFRQKETIEPPEDLSDLVAGQWVMKDSGFAVDGNEAMEKMQWFYEKETGDNVDGVMTIDTSAFEEILALTGPIRLDAYDKTISAENFRSETESFVHKDYFEQNGNLEENEPKKILADLMPIVLAKLLGNFQDQEKAFIFLNTGSKILKQKHLLLHVDNEDFQKRLNRYNYSGKIFNNNYEYLHINNSNINGEKSSQSISSEILVESKLSLNGTVESKLTYERKHNGKNEWPDGMNNNLVRILLPKDSRILSYQALFGGFNTWNNKQYIGDGSGYKLGEEASRPMMKFWQNTKPGETSKISVDYSFKTEALKKETIVYPVLFQQQPGAPVDNITYRLTIPSGYVPENESGYYSKATRTLEIKIKLDSDKLLIMKLIRV